MPETATTPAPELPTDPDAAEIDDRLAEIHALAALLPDALITKAPPAPGGTGTAGSKPPTRLDVLDLLDTRVGRDWTDPRRVGVVPYFAGWAVACTPYRLDPDDRPIDRLEHALGWLRSRLDEIADGPHWLAFAYGVRIQHRALRAATRLVRPADHTPPASCKCGGSFRVTGTGGRYRCTACDLDVEIRPVTLTEAARITGKPRRTLADWAKRGHMSRIATTTDPTAPHLYALHEIEAHIERNAK